MSSEERDGAQRSESRENCHDNTVAESFFATLEVEFLQLRRLEHLEEVCKVLVR